MGISENDILHRLLGYIFYVQAAKKTKLGNNPVYSYMARTIAIICCVCGVVTQVGARLPPLEKKKEIYLYKVKREKGK